MHWRRSAVLCKKKKLEMEKCPLILSQTKRKIYSIFFFFIKLKNLFACEIGRELQNDARFLFVLNATIKASSVLKLEFVTESSMTLICKQVPVSDL